jgi:hypothetical protein
MTGELHDLHRLIKQGHVPRASNPRIFSSFARRITAMSTGTSDAEGNASRCWCNAFAELRDLPFDHHQLRELDQFRNALNRRLEGIVCHLPESAATRIWSRHWGKGNRSKVMREIRGYSNSYMGFFESPKPSGRLKAPEGPLWIQYP